MKQIFVFLFSIIFCFHTLLGQKTRYFNFGPGVAFTVFDDYGMSPLPYEGFSGYLNGDIEKFSAKNWNDFALRGQFGKLSPVNKSGAAIHYFAELEYRHLLKTNWIKDEHYRLFVGPAINGIANQLQHNSYSNNVIHPIWDITLSISGRADRNFHLFKRRFNGALLLDLPLWGVGMRPGFAYGFPDGYYAHPDNTWKAIKESYFYVYPPKLIRLRTKAYLTYYLKNDNAIGLVYDWTFSKLTAQEWDNFNNVQVATHGLYFITKFKF